MEQHAQLGSYGLYGKNASRLMKTDVKENDEGYEVDVDLPGFNKDEIKLDLNNGYLTISTEKSLNKENKGTDFCRRLCLDSLYDETGEGECGEQ